MKNFRAIEQRSNQILLGHVSPLHIFMSYRKELQTSQTYLTYPCLAEELQGPSFKGISIKDPPRLKVFFVTWIWIVA